LCIFRALDANAVLCFIKIQNGLAFLVPACPCCPRKRLLSGRLVFVN